MNHREMLIGGHFIGGPCDQSVSKLVVKDPFTGSVFGTAAEAGWPEAQQAVDAAASAFSAWSQSPGSDRAQVLYAVSKLLGEREREVVEVLVGEIGKPVTWAEAEVRRAAITFQLAADFASDLHLEQINTEADPRSSQFQVHALREPIGPILCITPYNWPINLAAHKIGPALALGNTVVVKGSERSPLSTYVFARLLHDAGVPDGVVNCIVCDARTSQKLCADARFAAISFTGSPKVGWAIKDAFPRQRVVLELGGDAYAWVGQTANVADAIPRLVASAFGYAGQVCISLQHILVHESRLAEFREAFVAATLACPTGDPKDGATVCGPIIDGQEATRVLGLIQDALDNGAQLLCGGKAIGNWVEPTVLESPGPGARILTEEVFGPVVTLRTFQDLNVAIETINASPFGLQSAIFSHDPAEVDRFSVGVQSGGIVINDSPSVRFDAMPYGGNRESGFGREGIRFAADDFSQWKAIVRRLGT